MRGRKLFYYGFLALLWAPLLATLVSPQTRPFARSVLADPKSFDAELNRLRQATPLWNDAVAFYNRALYTLGVSGNAAVAVVGRAGWIFLGDLFNRNLSQAVGRRVLGDDEVSRWTSTLALQGKWLASRHIPYAFVVAPAKWSIYPDRLPSWTRSLPSSHSFDRVLAAAQAQALPMLDVRAALREARNHAETYSALNSHWTDYGAWVAWKDIAAALPARVPGLPALHVPALVDIPIRDEGNEFAGMLNISAANEWTGYVPDRPLADFAVIAADGSATPMPGGAKTDLLDLPRKTRNEHAGNRLRVLVLRDSSGNSLSPFLQDTFYMTYQLDHRLNTPGSGPNLIGLIEDFRPDFVLWIMTERYFNEPLGDLDYWRAVDAYECAGSALAIWPGTEGRRPLTVEGDPAQALKLTLPPSAQGQVLRIAVKASGRGALDVDSNGTAVSTQRKLAYSEGRNELFLALDRSGTDTVLNLRGDGTAAAVIEAAELRTSAACTREAAAGAAPPPISQQ